MNLVLQRLILTDSSTTGHLSVDGELECWTLELPVRDGKPGSAIPAGTYNVGMSPSPKFEKSTDPWVQKYAKNIPHLIDIPGRTTILIHWGNTPENTEGCILVGKVHQPDFIGESRDAFAELHTKLQGAVMRFDPITITVVDKPTS